MSTSFAVALIAAPVVVGVGALWWRRVNRQRAAAIAAMETRRTPRKRPVYRPEANPPPYVKTRAQVDASRSGGNPHPANPLPVDSWSSVPVAESHSFTGGGGGFDGAGASGGWGGSSSDSGSSSSDSGSSSSDSGGCGGCD